MAWDSAYATAAPGARAAHKYIFVFSLHTPGPQGFRTLSERKAQCGMENIAPVMPQFLLDIDRALGFQARVAITIAGQATFDGLGKPLVESVQTTANRAFAHPKVIRRKQSPRRIKREKCQRLKPAGPQFWSENTAVGQSMAVDFARDLVRQAQL